MWLLKSWRSHDFDILAVNGSAFWHIANSSQVRLMKEALGPVHLAIAPKALEGLS